MTTNRSTISRVVETSPGSAMDKKDIYEHLAKIYLDASTKKQTKTKILQSPLVRNLFILGAACIVIVGTLVLTSSAHKKGLFNSEAALILTPEVMKLNFDFNPAKKEIYSLDLGKLDLSRYQKLSFAVKKANPRDTISLRIEFMNAFNEKSAFYLKDISSRWENRLIDFSEFKNIVDWSEMTKLAFIVEEWNTTEKKSVVYVDNVRVMKHR